MSCEQNDGYCGRCRGMQKVLLGLLVLVNMFVWPQWTGVDGWIGFFAILAIVAGIAKIIKPCCNCPSACCGSGSCCETKPAVHETPTVQTSHLDIQMPSPKKKRK